MRARAVLIAVGVVVAVAGGMPLVFYKTPTREYRDCLELMWDRKHPVQVRQRYVDEAAAKCEKDRLSGADPTCDPNNVYSECERLARQYHTIQMAKCIQDGPDETFMQNPAYPREPENPCEHLSLEELRRADVEANRDTPPR